MSSEQNLNKFLNSLDELLNSKFILSSSCISELLHSIADYDEVYNLIAQCMINFDFIEEWQSAISGGRIEFPQDKSKRIAFIFCMLNNIDDKNLDLNKILEHYFSYDLEVKPYDLFKHEVVQTFKDLIFDALNIYFDNVDNDNVEQEEFEEYVEGDEIEESEESVEDIQEDEETLEEENNDEDKNLDFTDELEEMLRLVLEMKTEIRAMKKLKKTPISKTDLIALVSTLEFAIKTKSLEYFYALTLSIKHLTRSMKNLKPISEQIESISNIIIRS